MSIALPDVRLTVRRDRDGRPRLYPRLCSDPALLPKIAIAIRYFEGLLGHERGDLDADMFVQFFGDVKVTRCLLAALARSYRYRPRRLAEVLGVDAAQRLDGAGIRTPSHLRLALYDRVNADGPGFAREVERAGWYDRLGAGWGLSDTFVEAALYLDADERALLTRVGPVPRPEDVAALATFRIVEALLRQAERLELRLDAGDPAVAEGAERVVRRHGVDATFDRAGGTLCLLGHQDALGNWSRHGRRIVRAMHELLDRGRAVVRGGAADIALPGRRAHLPLGPDLLAILAGPAPADGAAEWADDEVERAENVAAVVAAVRAAGRGWSLRRQPEAQAWAAGVVRPDLLVRSPFGALQVCTVRSGRHAARLASLLPSLRGGEPLACVGRDAWLGLLRTVGVLAGGAGEVSPAWLEAAVRGDEPAAASTQAKVS